MFYGNLRDSFTHCFTLKMTASEALTWVLNERIELIQF